MRILPPRGSRRASGAAAAGGRRGGSAAGGSRVWSRPPVVRRGIRRVYWTEASLGLVGRASDERRRQAHGSGDACGSGAAGAPTGSGQDQVRFLGRRTAVAGRGWARGRPGRRAGRIGRGSRLACQVYHGRLRAHGPGRLFRRSSRVLAGPRAGRRPGRRERNRCPGRRAQGLHRPEPGHARFRLEDGAQGRLDRDVPGARGGR